MKFNWILHNSDVSLGGKGVEAVGPAEAAEQVLREQTELYDTDDTRLHPEFDIVRNTDIQVFVVDVETHDDESVKIVLDMV